MKIKSFECPKSMRNYKKNNAWNIRRLDEESFVPANQQSSVLYCKLSDFWVGVVLCPFASYGPVVTGGWPTLQFAKKNFWRERIVLRLLVFWELPMKACIFYSMKKKCL